MIYSVCIVPYRKDGGMTTTGNSRLSRIRRKRRTLSQGLSTCGRLIKGSLIVNRRRCGRQRCRCCDGELHESLAFTYKRAGKSVLVHIPEHLQAEAKQAQNDYRKVKRLVEQLSEVNIELLKHKAQRGKSRER